MEADFVVGLRSERNEEGLMVRMLLETGRRSEEDVVGEGEGESRREPRVLVVGACWVAEPAAMRGMV